jgi:redox-sensitive bicupin YhaK (pirin superfamily)
MGNAGTIVPGQVQRMSAGSGVTHSEMNNHAGTTHFLQIWLTPSSRGIKPSYEDATFSEAEKRGRWRLVASPDGVDGSVTIHTDARLYASVLREGDAVRLAARAR